MCKKKCSVFWLRKSFVHSEQKPTVDWERKTEQHLASAGAATERAAKPPTVGGKPGRAWQACAVPTLTAVIHSVSATRWRPRACFWIHRFHAKRNAEAGHVQLHLQWKNECGLWESLNALCVLCCNWHADMESLHHVFMYVEIRQRGDVSFENMHVWTITRLHFQTNANWEHLGYWKQLDETLELRNIQVNIRCDNTCTSCSYQSGGIIPFDMRQTWKRQTYISTINRIMRRKATVTECTSSNGGFHFTCGYDGTLHSISNTGIHIARLRVEQFVGA